MFSKAALLGLASVALVAAAPGYPGPIDNSESTCSAVTTYTTYEIDTTIAVYETSTSWITKATTIEGVVTGTSTWYETKAIVTSSPTCIETSYPLTVWVTKEVEINVPVTKYSTCTESSVWTAPTCTTVVTSLPELEICTEYTTECITTTAAIVTTVCEPCAPTTVTYV